jgi:hypothetical protein
VNELDILRREFDAVPEPDEETVAVVRDAVLREIAAAGTPKRRPRRHRLRFALAAGVALAALFAGLFIVHPRSHAGIGTQIAAAAYRAFTPPPNRIRHEISRYEISRSRGDLTEQWVTTSAPYAFRATYAYRAMHGLRESTLGPCGSMDYDPRLNLLTVTNQRIGTKIAMGYFAFRDPVQQYLEAYRGRHVRYRGKTRFRGVPAYILAVSSDADVITYLVRRDNYYPLRIVFRRGKSEFTTTYARFQYLPRNAETERLLTMRLHPHAFLMHFGGLHPRPACKRFGSYDSITEKGIR